VGQNLESGKLTPVPQMEKHRDLLREAVALHDRGKYDEAISKYLEILKENPDDIEAIYELAFSYAGKRDYPKSLEVAYKGLRYKSNFIQIFFVLIGNDLDHLGQREKAIKVYREGIKRFPRHGGLYYNLAIAYIADNKPDEAKKSLKDAVRVTPNHPGSHLGLSQLYRQEDYRIPALLAGLRFLIIEPTSQRSAPVLQSMKQLLMSGVQTGKEPNKIQIFVDPEGETDEGDFNTLSTAMGLVAAGRHLEENKNKSEEEIFTNQLSTLFAIMSEGSKKSKGFAWDYYRPYFIEMSNRKLAESFGYYIQQSTKSEQVSRWLAEHRSQVESLLAWSKSYKWPER
jgi:hypothetical protein